MPRSREPGSVFPSTPFPWQEPSGGSECGHCGFSELGAVSVQDDQQCPADAEPLPGSTPNLLGKLAVAKPPVTAPPPPRSELSRLQSAHHSRLGWGGRPPRGDLQPDPGAAPARPRSTFHTAQVPTSKAQNQPRRTGTRAVPRTLGVRLPGAPPAHTCDLRLALLSACHTSV